MRGSILWVAAMASLEACGQSDGGNVATNATANSAAPAVQHPTYCFYPDAATKGWTASTGKSGDVTVKGKAHLEDRRYMGGLGQAEIAGDKASVWLTMDQNTTGFGAVDNWWDVSLTIPGSGAVTSVTVMCGKKIVATLPVKRKG